MCRSFLTLTFFSIFILACGTVTANAQQTPALPLGDGRQTQKHEQAPPDRYPRREESDDWDERRGPGMTHRSARYERAWRRHRGSAPGTTWFGMMSPRMGAGR